MSTNITHVLTLSSSLILRAEDGLPERRTMPERHPIPDMFFRGARLPLPRLDWSGIWSGNSFYDGTFAKFCACTEGAADLVLIWETGDLAGVRIKDGAFTEHTVVYSLGDQIP